MKHERDRVWVNIYSPRQRSEKSVVGCAFPYVVAAATARNSSGGGLHHEIAMTVHHHEATTAFRTEKHTQSKRPLHGKASFMIAPTPTASFKSSTNIAK